MSLLDYVPVVGPILSNIGSSALSYKGQLDANRANRDIASATNVANAEMAQKQMDFQERMSNTSYQRAVEDMKKAGINPIMAALSGGASSPAGSSAAMVTGAPQQSTMSGVAKRVAHLFDSMKLKYELENMGATNEKIRSDTALNNALKFSAAQDAVLKANNARVARITGDKILLHMPGLRNKAAVDSSVLGKVGAYVGRGASHLGHAVSSAFGAKSLWNLGKYIFR